MTGAKVEIDQNNEAKYGKNEGSGYGPWTVPKYVPLKSPVSLILSLRGPPCPHSCPPEVTLVPQKISRPSDR